jgi:NADPH-ferrihemoprotein reductase
MNSTWSQIIVGASSVVVLVGTILYFSLGKPSTKSSSAEKPSPALSENKKGGDRPRTASNLEDKYPAGKMSVYFGSQTGTAEGFSRTIVAESHKLGFDAKMHDLEDFDLEQIRGTRLAIFLVATYGEGDPTDNAAKFYNWLKNEDKSVASDFFSPLQFAVFGLGNSQYENFNKMGRDFDRLINELGATRIFNYGEGDDDATLEDDFENWKSSLLPALKKRYCPSASDATAIEDASITQQREKAQLLFRTVPCAPLSTPPVTPPHSLINSSTKYFFNPHIVTVTTNREMRSPMDGGHTVHMELDIAGSGVQYYTADNLAVIPDNSRDIV